MACAAGLASLEILERDGLIGRVASMSPAFEDALHSLRDCSLVTDIRNYGFAGGLTIASAPGEPMLRPFQIAMAMWQKGFYVRYGADTIQLALPFSCEQEEIDSLINALGETINELAA